MADDAPEVVDCGKKKQFNNKVTARGSGNTVPAARTDAIMEAERAATRDALAEAAKYECPADCPEMRLDLELAKPVVDGKTLFVDPDDKLHHVNASCAWTCTISCWDHKIQGADKISRLQELYCSDDAVIPERGTATGKGDGAVLGNPPPPNAVAQAEATALAAALVSLALELSTSVKLAISDVRCPDDCPIKKIRIRLDPVSKPQTTAPDANDVVHCTVTRRYQVTVDCTD